MCLKAERLIMLQAKYENSLQLGQIIDKVKVIYISLRHSKQCEMYIVHWT